MIGLGFLTVVRGLEVVAASKLSADGYIVFKNSDLCVWMMKNLER